MTDFLVLSATMPDGNYGLSIEFGNDRAIVLDRAAALAYAEACCHQAATADHGAAVVRLLIERLGTPAEDAATFVRTNLVPNTSTAAATGPARFIATVGRAKHPRPDAGTYIGRIRLHYEGVEQGWIEPAELRTHATDVLTALAMTELDTQLLRTLVDVIGLDEPRARHVVHDLIEFMPGIREPGQ